MRYWQVERLIGGHWLTTDFRVGGTSEDDALAHLAETAGREGWTSRLGREVRPDDHYCDIAWLGAP